MEGVDIFFNMKENNFNKFQRPNMRELVFKALTTGSSNKRDLCIQETVEKDGVVANTQRRCQYFVLARAHMNEGDNVDCLVSLGFKDVPHKKRHYYVMKTHDSATGQDKLLCKVAGVFYAVSGSDLYCIAFVHTLKIIFTVAGAAKD